MDDGRWKSGGAEFLSFNAKTPGRKGRKDLREKRKLFAAGLDGGNSL